MAEKNFWEARKKLKGSLWTLQLSTAQRPLEPATERNFQRLNLYHGLHGLLAKRLGAKLNRRKYSRADFRPVI